MLYQVDTGYACAGIVVDPNNLRVVDAAPIFRWMIGKNLEEIEEWNKVQYILLVKEKENE